MSSPRVTATAVVLLALLAAAVPAQAAVACCTSLVTRNPYDDCNCLEDDTQVTGQTVAKDEYLHYHWRLTRWDIINVPDDERPSITFETSPCTGNVHLFVTPIQYPFPTAETARWKATNDYQVNSIRSRLLYAEYFVSVLGVEASNFSIIAVVNETASATAGNNGLVTAAAVQDDETILFEGDTMSMNVAFRSGNVPAEYRVYSGDKSVGKDCNANGNPGNCVVASGCGLASGSFAPMTNWLTFGPNEDVAVTVQGLQQNTPYVFNVAMRTANYTIAYAATEGIPTYQRVTQAQSDSTILIVVGVVAGVFVLLVGLIIWAKMRLNRAYQRHQYLRYQNPRDQ